MLFFIFNKTCAGDLDSYSLLLNSLIITSLLIMMFCFQDFKVNRSLIVIITSKMQMME
eukprot:c31350_g1_i1 orf=208-381(+)